MPLNTGAVMPAYNPYALPGGGASLTSNPYALSPGLTSSGYANSPGYSHSGYGGGGGGYGGGGYGMGYNPYGGYYDPYGGYYRGIGDLITSYGKYYNQYQQARLASIQVSQARIDLRRRIYDEWRYYRESLPKAEEIRQERIKRNLDYSRRQPASTEILNGTSLNDLLAHLKDVHGKKQAGPEISLNPEMLKKINVQTDRGGNPGLFKNGGKLSWPLPLTQRMFEELRKTFELRFEDAYNSAKTNGKVDDALKGELRSELDALINTLEKNVNKLSTGQYIAAKRYSNQLSDALRVLDDPNVRSYFNDTFAAKGKTVEQLIAYMTENGLKFAPATPGDEPAYRALQTYLVGYDDGVTRLASSR